ncbi:Delta3-Delta2-enoyl-CoA isomerase, partial [Lecanoromycetidae sp. Uapishka_2]
MPPIPALFVLPLPPSGRITCTQPAPRIYLLTFDSPPDNRMTPAFCSTFLLALDILDHRFPKGVVITTSGIQKFYSNGLDYESAIKTQGFFSDYLYPLWRRLLTYPMPTVAVLPGHAFAAGLMTAMMHDYRLMNPHRGFICLNELDFGAPLKPPMASIFRQKVPNPNTFRTMILESKRYGALEALKEGLLDGLGGIEEALAFAKEMGLVDRARSGVYGQLKREMWGETVKNLETFNEGEQKTAQDAAEDQRRSDEEKRRVEEWERSATRQTTSKL